MPGMMMMMNGMGWQILKLAGQQPNFPNVSCRGQIYVQPMFYGLCRALTNNCYSQFFKHLLFSLYQEPLPPEVLPPDDSPLLAFNSIDFLF